VSRGLRGETENREYRVSRGLREETENREHKASRVFKVSRGVTESVKRAAVLFLGKW
jgi:hypothetical protein